MSHIHSITVGIQTGTDRTMYATWVWDKEHTDYYDTRWYYSTGNSVWFLGNDSTTKYKQTTYSAPDNAIRIKFKVRPVSKTYKVNDKDTKYWVADWSSYVYYNLNTHEPDVPAVPTVTIDKYKLTAEFDTYDSDTDRAQFHIVTNDTKTFGYGIAKKVKNHISYSCTITAGKDYKVRARGINDDYGDSSWSEYSGNVSTIPLPPTSIDSCKAISETAVQVHWPASKNTDSYTVEYTTATKYFNSGGSMVSSVSIDSYAHHAEITGLDIGQEWFFRVKSVNTQGESGWTAIVSTLLGSVPTAPTTWSTTTTAVVGEQVMIYWTHNSKDGSDQTYAEIELINNGSSSIITVPNTTPDETISSYDLSSYVPLNEGTQFKWRVRTRGILPTYSDWSVQRIINVYAPASLAIEFKSGENPTIDTLTEFPLTIIATPGPETQTAIGYFISITANEGYESQDSSGGSIVVSQNEEIYSKNFSASGTELQVILSAMDINFENNITYTINCSVSMSNGLSAKTSSPMTISWTEFMYEPNAAISIDTDTLTASVMPYCEDDLGNLIDGVLMSIYRRNFDGEFIELATGLNNLNGTFVTDPHPALDYARYRVIATSVATGAISYYDVPGYPVGEAAIIIQWDEEWVPFDGNGESAYENPAWTGSILRLPYNVDVSDSNSNDVSLVEYIGRKRPVSYYGTQLGETSTWSVDIIKSDEETLYALRKLKNWMGDVYVREPSGSGYWANISVSFSQTHGELVIPVSMSITRVDGGA